MPKISELAAASALTGAETMVLVQGGATVRAGLSAIRGVMDNNVRYVSKSGSNANSGLTWSEAKLTVAAAVRSLPVANAGTSEQRHIGKVYVGGGQFQETDTPIPIAGGLSIEGVGMGLTGSPFNTHISVATDGRDSELFSYRVTQGYTNEVDNPPALATAHYMHGFSLRNVILDGGKTWNTTNTKPIVRMTGGGFGCELDNVLFREVKSTGLYIERNALTLSLRRVNYSKCDGKAFHFRQTDTTHTHISVFGGETDNCGLGVGGIAHLYESVRATGADTKQWNIYDHKFECNSDYLGLYRPICYQPMVASPVSILGGGNTNPPSDVSPPRILVSGVGASKNRGTSPLEENLGDAVVYEAAGHAEAPGASFVLLNVMHGAGTPGTSQAVPQVPGYNYVYQSAHKAINSGASNSILIGKATPTAFTEL